MTLPLQISGLRIRGFRNLTDLSLDLSPRINVISGPNGHGKTSVLEAVYFLATSRSFRTERLGEAKQQGAEHTRVETRLIEGDIPRQQTASFEGNRRRFEVDGKKPERLSSYATRTPVVVFHPGDLQLIGGSAAARRTLLDRIALYMDATSADARSRYATAQRERQVLLERRGTDAAELDIFEQLMATSGRQIRHARMRAFVELRAAVVPAFRAMAATDLEFEAELLAESFADETDFARILKSMRVRDRARKSASFGPQRDDIRFQINGREARKHASQGQQRVLALAVKMAELACVREARGSEPILLLDDVSSELDPERTGAVYDFVREANGQVLVTTTRPELFSTPSLGDGQRRDFRLVGGSLQG